MFEKNELKTGLIIGAVVPIIGAVLLFIVHKTLEFLDWDWLVNLTGQFRLRTVILLAICFNILTMRYYYNKKFVDTMQGIIISTLAFGVIWALFFKDQLFVNTQ